MSERPSVPSFTPIRPNPYIVGNPVRDRSMFFGREAEFELVRERFHPAASGGMLVFCGERRSGKTSILFQILDRRLGPDFIPVLIDMQSMAVGSEVEFLARLSDEILASLGAGADGIAPPRFLETSNHSAAFRTFVRDVLRAQPRKRLVLLFDEYELFENKIDAGLLAEDVLHVLASLMETDPVFLIFTGSEHLEQRRREYWKILGKSQYKRISFLDPDDAVKLIRKPVEGRVEYGEGSVEAICRLTAGQPFYTQAICQSVVDHLNERRTSRVSPDLVAEVAEGIVNNPLPQMIFQWDGLERDDKLALALLAECLGDAAAHAGVDDVMRLLGRREYPLEMDKPRVATALEKFFKAEMLLRSDRTEPPGYAFRMDLWRLWIRRQHSVWQVMREVGIDIRRGPRARRARWIAAGTAAAALVGAVLVAGALRRDRGAPAGGPLGVPGPSGTYALEAEPAEAVIYLDGRRIGLGTFKEAISAGRDHRFRVSAAGYADSEFVVRVAPGASAGQRVALRALLGDARIETRPPGAEVKVDGRAAGRSPATVRGLTVAGPHRVEASLAGHAPAAREFRVEPGGLAPVTLVLEVGRTDVTVVTEPEASEVRVNGSPRGTSPVLLAGLAFGNHRLSAAREGYLPAETTVVVTADTRRIRLALAPEPPGVLVVQGDRPARIFINGDLVMSNTQNSGPRELASGVHEVRVVLASGDAVDKSVAVRSRERVIYDYSTGKIDRRPEGRP